MSLNTHIGGIMQINTHGMQQICRIYLFFKTKMASRNISIAELLSFQWDPGRFVPVWDSITAWPASLNNISSSYKLATIFLSQTPSVMIGGVRLKIISTSGSWFWRGYGEATLNWFQSIRIKRRLWCKTGQSILSGPIVVAWPLQKIAKLFCCGSYVLEAQNQFWKIFP